MFNWNTINKDVKRNLEEIVPGYLNYMRTHNGYTGIDYYISFILLKDTIEKIDKSLGRYFKAFSRLQYSLYYDNKIPLTDQLLLIINVYPKNDELSQDEHAIIKEFIENTLGFEEFTINSVANIIEPEYKIIIKSNKLTQLYNKVKSKLQQRIILLYNNISSTDIDNKYNYHCLSRIMFDFKATL